ncbi:MAG: hypothetical protein WC822_01285 [Candidatus Paceibacterota bacterium]
MVRSIFDDLGTRVSSAINRTNPGSSFKRTSTNPKQDWLKVALDGYRQRAAQAAAEIERRRKIEEAEEAARKAAEKGQKKNWLQRNLPLTSTATDIGGELLDAALQPAGYAKRGIGELADTRAGRKTTSTIGRVPGLKRTWDEFNAIGTAGAGAFTSPFGRLEIQYQPTPDVARNPLDPNVARQRVRAPERGGQRREGDPGIPTAVRRFDAESVKAGPKNFLSVDKVRKENKMMRDAGLEVSDNPYRRVQQTGDQWYQTPDVSTGVKVGVGVLADPTTWVPAGGLSAAARAARLQKVSRATGLARVGSKIPAGGKLAVGARELIEGARNPAVTVGSAVGMGLAAQGAEEAGLGTKGTLAAVLGGAGIGGAIPSMVGRGFKGGKPPIAEVRSERDAPTGRKIIPNSTRPELDISEWSDGTGRKTVYVYGRNFAQISPNPDGSHYVTFANDGRHYYFYPNKTLDDIQNEIAAKVTEEPDWFKVSPTLIPERGGWEAVGINSGTRPQGELRRKGGVYEWATADGDTVPFESTDDVSALSELVERAGEDVTFDMRPIKPKPLANERLWFHSTVGDHEYLDPEFGVRGTFQFPGAYHAADPKISADSYGNRTFVTEFDGRALDLTDDIDYEFWDNIADQLGVARPSAADLRFWHDPKNSRAKTASKSKNLTNYVYRDYIWGEVSNWDIDRLKDATAQGRFHRAIDNDAFTMKRKEQKLAEAVVQDAIGNNGYDAVYHYAPGSDGEVLIVINGERLRTVGEMKNGSLVKGSPRGWDDIRAEAGTSSGPVTMGDWLPGRVPGAGKDGVLSLFSNGSRASVYTHSFPSATTTGETGTRFFAQIDDINNEHSLRSFDSMSDANKWVAESGGLAYPKTPEWSGNIGSMPYGESTEPYIIVGLGVEGGIRNVGIPGVDNQYEGYLAGGPFDRKSPVFETKEEASYWVEEALEDTKLKWTPGDEPGEEFFFGRKGVAIVADKHAGHSAEYFQNHPELSRFTVQVEPTYSDTIDKSFSTMEEARAFAEETINAIEKPGFKIYDGLGGTSESGQANVGVAAALAVPAAGAAIGYAADDEEGALVGAGLGAAGVAGALGARGLLGRGDPTNIPSPAAVAGQPGPALPKAPLSTGIDRFKIGTAAHEQTGVRIGDVVGIDGSTGTLQIDTGAGIVSRPANSVYSLSDYAKFVELSKTNRSRRKAMAPQRMIDAARARNEEYLRYAREAVGSSSHWVARGLPKLGGLLDPGSKFRTPVQKRVHAAILASANMIHRGDSIAAARADRMLKVLDPLMGEGRTAPLRKGASIAASTALPGVAGIMAAELTGDQEWAELGVLGGAVTGSLAARNIRNGAFRDTRWKDIPPRNPAALTGKIKDASSQERLIDILQYWDGPEGYDFTGLDPKRQAALTQAKQQWDALELQELQEVNAALAVAGQQPIPFRPRHGVAMSYTPDSLIKAGITHEYAETTDIRTTSFRREQKIEKRRELGDTLREVFAKQPDLKLTGGVRDLFIDQIRQQERIKAGSLITADLVEAGHAKQFPDDIAQMSMTPAQRSQIKADREALTKNGWRAMPGVDDTLFHPEAVSAVKDLLVSTTGSDNAAINMLDMATNMARTALFVGDLNAWSMQGVMAMIQNPTAAMRNFIPLVGATAFGQRYADWFKLRHPELVERAAKRGVRSYEHGGLELEFPGVHKIPAVRNLEERAIAFLDIMRLIMQDNIAQQEAFIKGVSPRSTKGFRGAVGKVMSGDLGHVGIEAARLGPVGVGIGAAVMGEGIGGEDADWTDNLMTVALGLGGSLAMDSVISRGGQYAMDSRRVNGRTSDLEIKAGTTAGKTTNRISGTVNRQQQGISSRQSQIERILLMRSPALTRNAVTLAKLAATDVGAEGALARAYLVKTAILYGTAMVFANAVRQGRMPEDSDFDPTNNNSPFSPEMFMRSDLGRGGTLSASNPLISLARALMYNDHPTGESDWHTPDPSEIGQGLVGFFGNRTPDITGQFTNLALGKMATGIPDTEPQKEPPGLINRLENGDVFGLAVDAAKTGLPVSAQSAFETGILDRTAIGQRLGTVNGDPNYNYTAEELLGVSAAWAGLNHNPESLGKELVVRKDETAASMFPGKESYNQLNDEQAKDVRERLGRSQSYKEATAGRKAQYGGDEEVGPIDQYLGAQRDVNTAMANKLAAAEKAYNQTGDAVQFRKRMSELATERRTRLDQVQADLANASAEQRGHDGVTVDEWLSRNMQPEDMAVEGYYDLFEQATDAASGKLDFEELETLQADYLASLPRSTRAYVNRRINFDKPLTPGQQEYEGVKEVTKPYFEAREKHFEDAKGMDPFLQGFSSYSDFRAFTKSIALQNGITEDQALSSMAMQSPGVKIFQLMAELEGNTMRLTNPELDAALVKWYGYAPKDPTAKIQRKLGRASVLSTPIGQLQPERTRGIYSEDVAKPKSGFKRRTRLWDVPTP